jgi:hypothetical protein
LGAAILLPGPENRCRRSWAVRSHPDPS